MNAHESCGRIVRTWLLVLVAAATGLAQQAGAPITIRAAQVFDGRGGVQRDVVVTVRGSKIERVAPAAGAVTYDLGSMTLLPGYGDALSGTARRRLRRSKSAGLAGHDPCAER